MKHINLLLLLFVVASTLVSCSKDDDTELEEISIVGTWEASRYITIKEPQNGEREESEELAKETPQKLTFKADGTGELERHVDSEWGTIPFSYLATDGTLKIDYQNEYEEVAEGTYDLKTNEITLTYTWVGDIEILKDVTIYKRIN